MSYPGRIYSERLIQSNNQSGWVYWQVPGDRRAVLGDIAAANFGAAAVLLQVAVNAVAVWNRKFLTTDEAAHLDLRQVAHAGEFVGVYMSVTGLAVSISGYLFVEPPVVTGRLAAAASVVEPPWPDPVDHWSDS
jgi:hypothetical protein